MSGDVDRRLDVARRFLLAVLDDPALLDGIANDSVLYLLPEEDPAVAARGGARGERLAREGHAVTLRPVRLADLPA